MVYFEKSNRILAELIPGVTVLIGTHKSEYSYVQYCALERNKKACVPIPLNMFAFIPSNYTNTIAEHSG